MKRICPAIELLNDDCKHCIGKICHFDHVDRLTFQKLTSLGVCKGCPISIEKQTIFADPIIFQINDSRIALRKKEAQLLMIEL